MAKTLRILHVLTGMNLAGTETLLMNLYRNIDREKVQFDFAVTAEKECAYDAEILELGGKIIRYPLYRGINHFSYVSWWNNFFKNHPEYHVVHGHIGSTAAIYLSIAKKYGCYTIAHSHSTYGPMNLHTFLYKVYSYPTRFIADYFMGCSQDALVSRYGTGVLKYPNHFILKNGIDAKKYIYSAELREKIRKEFHIEPGKIVIGTVGRLTPQKNPQFIIQLIKELDKRGVDFQFLWVGTGEKEKEIRDALHSELANRHVLMVGAQTDVYALLQAMDIFVFPSVFEGLGIAAIESQAADLPTLCSSTIPAEVNISDRCQFLSINDVTIWANALQEIIAKKSYHFRKDQYGSIKRAGYDIIDVVKKLTKMYLDFYHFQRN